MTLSNDLKKINTAANIFIFGSKTKNIHETTPVIYNKLLKENITKSYEFGKDETVSNTDNELKDITSQLLASDRVEKMAKHEAFISLKNDKENFHNNLTCRFINPTKSESRKISKILLDRSNTAVSSACNVNQWQVFCKVIEWFRNMRQK